MHTVVFGWFGVSVLWLVPLAFRLAWAAFMRDPQTRGRGTIRLWLGFAGVFIGSGALEAALAPNTGNALGHALLGLAERTLGRGAFFALPVLVLAGLPWLMGFSWRGALRWADRAFGLGLNIGPGAAASGTATGTRDDESRSVRGGLNGAAVRTTTTNAMAPKSTGRYARPTVWQPPAPSGAKARPVVSTGSTGASVATTPGAARGIGRDARGLNAKPFEPAGAGRTASPASARSANEPSGAIRTAARMAPNVATAATTATTASAHHAPVVPTVRHRQVPAAFDAGGRPVTSPMQPRDAAGPTTSARATQTTTERSPVPSFSPSTAQGAPHARPNAAQLDIARPTTPQGEPSPGVLETLKAIEANAAQWTALASSSLARRGAPAIPRQNASPEAASEAPARADAAVERTEPIEKTAPASEQSAQSPTEAPHAPWDAIDSLTMPPEANEPPRDATSAAPSSGDDTPRDAGAAQPVGAAPEHIGELPDSAATTSGTPHVGTPPSTEVSPPTETAPSAITPPPHPAAPASVPAAAAAPAPIAASAAPVAASVLLELASAPKLAPQPGASSPVQTAPWATPIAAPAAAVAPISPTDTAPKPVAPDARAAASSDDEPPEPATLDGESLKTAISVDAVPPPIPVVLPPEPTATEAPEPAPAAIPAPMPDDPTARPAALRGHAATEFTFHAPAASTVELPSLDLLEPASSETEEIPAERLAQTGQLIEQRLQEFKVPVTVVGASAGPVITRFEIEPALGVRGSQIVGLMKDLSRGLGLTSIRVVETIPGKTCMGLELPNAKRQTIRLSEILAAAPYQHSASKLTIAMGKDITGVPIVADLAKAPHMLVAGTTGSGKSVAINAMIVSLLYKATPEEVRLIMIDPKMLELSVYEGIPHLLAPVVTDMKLAANALNWCVGEMEKRYRLMSAVGVRNLAGFNQKLRDAQAAGKKIGNPFSLTPDAPEPLSPLPLIVVVIDELADLMMVAGKKIEELIARLAQKARAAGIHLILATQRPSVDVITGLIKANIPTRVAFQVSSKIDSRTILDQMGAESLLGQGDMLFLPPGTGYPQRVHGAFVADEEVHRVVEHLKQFGEPEYEEGILDGPATDGAPQDLFGDAPDAEADPLYDEAVAFVVRTRRASISAVQRQLRIGYNRAARLVEQMEAAGLVSSMGVNGTREVIAPPSSEP